MRLRRLSRSPLLFWAVVVLLALLTASMVGRLVGRARAEAARYGSLQSAAVATRAVEVGAVVGPDDVTLRHVPAAFLPEGWAGSPEEVVGRTVVAAVFPGQAVLREQLAPDGIRGIGAALPPGGRAVGVPTGPAGPPLEKGDVVDVLATFDPEAAGSGDPTFPVASAALVVDVGEESATVAVTAEEANRVAFAVVNGVVTLAVTAGPPRVTGPGGRSPGTAGGGGTAGDSGDDRVAGTGAAPAGGQRSPVASSPSTVSPTPTR